MDMGGNDGGCGAYAPWPVGSEPMGDSAYGLHDMAGNVWEWTRDWNQGYGAAEQTDPAGPPSGSKRVLRGGGLFDWYGALRGSSRVASAPSLTSIDVGFRCARTYP